jgi:hypothetical protein
MHGFSISILMILLICFFEMRENKSKKKTIPPASPTGISKYIFDANGNRPETPRPSSIHPANVQKIPATISKPLLGMAGFSFSPRLIRVYFDS